MAVLVLHISLLRALVVEKGDPPKGTRPLLSSTHDLRDLISLFYHSLPSYFSTFYHRKYLDSYLVSLAKHTSHASFATYNSSFVGQSFILTPLLAIWF